MNILPPPPLQFTNDDLSERLRNGNPEAFEIVFYKYRGRLFNFVRKSIPDQEDAAEIVQEVFAKLWACRQSIDTSLSFDAFIYTITRNEIFGHLRKLLCRRKYTEKMFAQSETANNTTEGHVEYAELQRIITALIQSLPPKRREVFLLSRDQGLSYKQIAEHLGISENTVDTQIRKALAHLKEGLQKKMILPMLFLF